MNLGSPNPISPMRAVLFSARFNSRRDLHSSSPWMEAKRLSPKSMKHSSDSPEQSTCSVPLHYEEHEVFSQWYVHDNG